MSVTSSGSEMALQNEWIPALIFTAVALAVANQRYWKSGRRGGSAVCYGWQEESILVRDDQDHHDYVLLMMNGVVALGVSIFFVGFGNGGQSA